MIVPAEDMLFMNVRNFPLTEESERSAMSENQLTVIMEPKRAMREYITIKFTGSDAKGINAQSDASIILPITRKILLEPALSLTLPQSIWPPLEIALALDCSQPISTAEAPIITAYIPTNVDAAVPPMDDRKDLIPITDLFEGNSDSKGFNP